MGNLLKIGRGLPRQSIGDHHHDHWELVAYLIGSGVTTIDSIEYPFRPGTIACLPPGCRHEEIGKGHYQSIWVHFRSGSLLPRKPVVINEPAHAPLTQLAKQICSEYLSEEKKNLFFCDQLLEALLWYLAKYRGKSAGHPVVDEIRRTLIAHVHDTSFKVNAILKNSSLSVHHLSKLFTKETGLSPRQYLITLRMREAAASLLLGEMTVAEVAHNFGFHDAFHFSRLFKKHMGSSPKEFRLRGKL